MAARKLEANQTPRCFINEKCKWDKLGNCTNPGVCGSVPNDPDRFGTPKTIVDVVSIGGGLDASGVAYIGILDILG